MTEDTTSPLDGFESAEDPSVGEGMPDQTSLPVRNTVPSRSKTISWQDPHALAAAGRGLSGLEFLTLIANRELPAPPIAELFGMTIESVSPGDAVFRCEPDESTYNPIGVVHGGLACVLLDTVAGCAVHTTLAAGVGYTSLEIKVNYLRPIHGGTVLTAHGWVSKPGRRVAFAEGDLRDPDGTLLATASSCCLVMGG
jgi:uncharacterized protein (TIGR00369 family)